MKIAMRILVIIVVLSLPGLVGAGVFYWKFLKPIPSASFEPPSGKTEARLQDLQYLRRLPDYDKSFDDAQEREFLRFIGETEKNVETMSDAAFLMAAARAVAISENGHTNVALRDLAGETTALPVKFFWFGDGLHVVRAKRSHRDLLGARVTAIDGREPEALVAALDPYFGGNDAFLRYNSVLFLSSPPLLHAAGLAESPDRVALEIVDRQGTERRVVLDADAAPDAGVRVGTFTLPAAPGGGSDGDGDEDGDEDWAALPDDVAGARYGAKPTEIFWADDLPGGGAYLRLRRTWGAADASLADFLSAARDRLAADPAPFLVLDLRSNPGGDYMQTRTFAQNIAEFVRPGGRVYVLADNGTFSAAVVTAAFVLHAGGESAVLAGEPMGDGPRFWAEGARVMTLPNSGVRVSTASAYHDWADGCSDWGRCYWVNILFGVAAGDFDVDMPAPLTFADYIRGQDTAINAIVAAETRSARAN